MPYLERGDKFWEMTRDGASTTTRYGKVGKKGRTSTKTHASERVARDYFNDKVAGKYGDGYARATPPSQARSAAVEPVWPPRPVGGRTARRRAPSVWGAPSRAACCASMLRADLTAP